MTQPPAPNLLERFRSGQVPLPGRMAAAQGALPLPPEQLLMVLFILRKDPEEEVRSQVIQTVREMPEGTLLPVLENRKLHPAVLDFYARVCLSRKEVLETILINPSTHDKTVEHLAEHVGPEAQGIIAGNQVRISRTPSIAEALRKNPNLDSSVQRRLEEVLENIRRQEAGKPPAAQEAAEPAPEATPAPAAEAGPAETEPEGTTEPAAEEPAAEETDADLLEALDQLESEALEDTGEAELEEALDESLTDEGGSLQVRLSGMTVMEKVELARNGSAEARSLLVRDKNKSIRDAVLKSPKLTDQEIEAFAANRSLPDEVLRAIGGNRDWIKNYTVMHKLVTNPKAPVGMTMRFLPRLNIKDLKDLSKNRNVPGALRTIAQRMFDEKQKPKTPFKKGKH